jgi:hypothetical protein
MEKITELWKKCRPYIFGGITIAILIIPWIIYYILKRIHPKGVILKPTIEVEKTERPLATENTKEPDLIKDAVKAGKSIIERFK